MDVYRKMWSISSTTIKENEETINNQYEVYCKALNVRGLRKGSSKKPKSKLVFLLENILSLTLDDRTKHYVRNVSKRRRPKTVYRYEIKWYHSRSPDVGRCGNNSNSPLNDLKKLGLTSWFINQPDGSGPECPLPHLEGAAGRDRSHVTPDEDFRSSLLQSWTTLAQMPLLFTSRVD